jgi:hypothetical protein
VFVGRECKESEQENRPNREFLFLHLHHVHRFDFFICAALAATGALPHILVSLYPAAFKYCN